MSHRTELWNQMLAFDAKENDPNRFKNRGGNLLAEEREKKKVLHLLPKVSMSGTLRSRRNEIVSLLLLL